MIKNLIAIQNELKAPKSNYNSFGKYRYRSAENILEAVKPLLQKYKCQLLLTDDVIAVGNRVYIKATATITDTDGNSETVSALARESDSKKGMDDSQITGTASSYARKYALNGLFLIDDCKDADCDEYRRQTEPDEKPQIDRDFLKEHGKERISPKEVKELEEVCKSGKISRENILTSCNKSRLCELTYFQYYTIMNRLNAA